MAKTRQKTPALAGRFASLGLTFYCRKGQVIARSSTRGTTHWQTTAQFALRQRISHLSALWSAFPADGKPLTHTPEGLNTFQSYLRLNSHLPAVYLTRQQTRRHATVLLPGLVVSSGPLSGIGYRFDTLPDGHRLLVTDLATGLDTADTLPLTVRCANDLSQLLLHADNAGRLHSGDTLCFYTLRQRLATLGGEPLPHLDIATCRITLDDDPRPAPQLGGLALYTHGGHLALGNVDDTESGWAIARYNADKDTASFQKVATTATLHEQYTSPQALARASQSRGNVRDPYLTPSTTP